MTKTNKKLIVAIAIALAAATAAGAGIHLIAGENANDVSENAAKEIALAHAGFSEAEVTLQKVKLDRDDGRAEYEIEFRKEGVKYEYEIDAESGEIISFDRDGKLPVGTNADGTPVTVTVISADDAKAAALAHAGLDASEVTFSKVKLDRDDGRDEYEIEFRKDNVKYEYEIDAETGGVISYDKEIKKNAVQTTQAPQTTAHAAPAPATDGAAAAPETTAAPKETTAPVAVAEQLTAENAKAIALAHAGLGEADVTFTKVKREKDDGRTEYELEFYHGGYEYEYEIDAESGSILDFEKDYDD